MQVTKRFRVDAAPESVWQALGPGYAEADKWASGVFVSTAREGTPKVDAPMLGRVCQSSIGPITETIEVYDSTRRRLVYSAKADKMPGFVSNLQNGWEVTAAKGGGSDVTMRLTADLAFPFNLLMGVPMKLQFSRLLGQSAEEFRHWVETGTQHPRKRKVDAGKAAMAARAAAA